MATREKEQPSVNQGTGALETILSKATSGAKYRISLQFVTRFLSFVLNVLIVRVVSKEDMGSYSVQFQTIVNVSFHLFREWFRRTALRTDTNAEKSQQLAYIKKVSYFSVVAGMIGTPLLCALFLRMFPIRLDILIMFAISIIIEFFCEPISNVLTFIQEYKTRSYVEGAAMTVRCIFTLSFAFITKKGIEAFAIGDIIHSIILFLGFYIFGSKTIQAEFQTETETESDSKKRKRSQPISFSFGLSSAYFVQSVQKALLGEGERMLIWSHFDPSQQAVWSVVNNIGSLVARVVFLPIEEIAFNTFAKMTKLESNKTSDKHVVSMNKKVICLLVKLMLIIAMFAIAFGTNYANAVIDIIYGRKYSETEAPQLLSLFCVYIGVMAVNGITEAFVQSVASPSFLHLYNVFLFVLSCAYLWFATFLINHIGVRGCIVGNIASMCLRIIISLIYMNFYYEEKNWLKNALVNFKTSLGIIASGLIIYFLGIIVNDILRSRVLVFSFHILGGIICFVVVASSLYLNEWRFLRDIECLFSGKPIVSPEQDVIDIKEAKKKQDEERDRIRKEKQHQRREAIERRRAARTKKED